MEISNVTLDLLRLSLDMATSEQKVAAANIANANVEGYQKIGINFQDMLNEISSMDDWGQKIVIDGWSSNWQAMEEQAIYKISDEQVKLDEEVASSIKASMKYEALIEGVNRKYGMMRLVVSNGRG
ncbi:MAG: hypothetical protein HRT37_07930 [Alteromonadaceae bacterium]|nr:hypothetical protein [Alteromonadaceae bacterium]